MNGVGETKAVLLMRVVDKMDDIEKNGCAYGKVLEEKECGLHRSMDEVKTSIKEIGDKLTTGIIVVIILALFAGGNMLEAIMQLFLRH